MDEREAALLKKRLKELDNKASQGFFEGYSDFLDLYGQDIFLSLGLSGRLFGGYDDAERKIACFGGFNPPIKYIKTEPKNKKFSDSLCHRDILGALMSLGIKRETLGDILISRDFSVIICLEKIAKYICENLESIRHTSVKCTVFDKLPDNILEELSEKSETLTVFTSSLRIDALIAAVFSLSRNDAQKIVASERVFSNGRLVTSPSVTISENVQISVRGFGRFYLDCPPAETKKGRLRCTVVKK